MAARFSLDRTSVRKVRPTLSVSRLRTLTRLVLRRTSSKRTIWNISVVFVGPKTIQELNAQYRGRNVPTDVLSFALNEGKWAVPATEGGVEIFLCPTIIKERAGGWEKSEQQATEMLFVHALLHAQGHDHESDADHARMRRAEIRILGGSLQ